MLLRLISISKRSPRQVITWSYQRGFWGSGVAFRKTWSDVSIDSNKISTLSRYSNSYILRYLLIISLPLIIAKKTCNRILIISATLNTVWWNDLSKIVLQCRNRSICLLCIFLVWFKVMQQEIFLDIMQGTMGSTVIKETCMKQQFSWSSWCWLNHNAILYIKLLRPRVLQQISSSVIQDHKCSLGQSLAEPWPLVMERNDFWMRSLLLSAFRWWNRHILTAWERVKNGSLFCRRHFDFHFIKCKLFRVHWTISQHYFR